MNLKDILKKLKLSEQTISTVLGAIVVIIVGILLFSYFRGSVRKTTTTDNKTEQEQQSTTEEGNVIPEGLPTTYKVQKGDNLWMISTKYFGSGYNWIDIAKENKLANPSLLSAEQELSIPKVVIRKPQQAEKIGQKPETTIEGQSYTVVKGDNLWKIAVRAYGDGYRWTVIAKANNLINPGIIHPGNVLTLPR